MFDRVTLEMCTKEEAFPFCLSIYSYIHSFIQQILNRHSVDIHSIDIYGDIHHILGKVHGARDTNRIAFQILPSNPQPCSQIIHSFINTLYVFYECFLCAQRYVDTGDAVLKHRHGVCPGGASIQVVDLKTSVDGKGCVPPNGLVAVEGAQNYLGEVQEENISSFIYFNLILLYLLCIFCNVLNLYSTYMSFIYNKYLNLFHKFILIGCRNKNICRPQDESVDLALDRLMSLK